MIFINFDDQFKENIKKQANQTLIDKGFDELNRFLLVLIIIGLFIDIFFKIFIVGVLEIIFIIIFLYRLLSKNTYKRVKTNRIFKEVVSYIKKPFQKLTKIFRKKSVTIKNKNKLNLYKKCPKCGLILKLPLPKKRGIKHTTCPDCGTRFAFFTLKVKKGSR